MNIGLTVCWSVIAILLGYCGVCCYLHGAKLRVEWPRLFKMRKSKLFYLVAGLCICGTMIVLFQVTYQLTLLNQIKLLSLVLVILPTAAVDLRVHKMPNQFLLVGFAIRIILLGVAFLDSTRTAWAETKDCLIGAFVYGGFFLLMLLVFKNSIGMGDIKLFALIGFYQGLWGAFSSVFFSLLASFFLSIFLLITKKKDRHDLVAFGPCILIGTFISICLSGM